MFFAESLVPQHPLVEVVQNVSALARWEQTLIECARRGFISYDTETSGFDYWGRSSKFREGPARIIGHCVGYDLHDGHGPRGVYFPIRHQTVDAQLPVEAVTQMIQRLLGDPSHQVAMHFAKFDWHLARCDGIEVQATVHDTHIMAHLLDENRELQLEKIIAQLNLDPDPTLFKKIVADTFTDVCRRYGAYKNHKKHGFFYAAPGYQWIPVPILGPYGAWDARLTLLAAYALYPGVRDHYWGLYGTELAVLKSIEDAEFRGTPIDIPYLEYTTDILEGQLEDLTKKIRKLAGSQTFEPGNDDEVRDFLYGHMRIPVTHYTANVKWGSHGEMIRTPAVDVVALSYIKHEIGSPIVDRILEFRKVDKLLSTYCKPIIEYCDPSGYLHGRMEQMGTVTGRFASKEPNLQNMPADDDKHPERSIRRAFLAPHGKVRLILDWSQIELRVLAVEAQEPTMIEAFCQGRDLHSETSMMMFGNTIKSNRAIAKRIGFGISYGLSPIGLMNQFNKEADPEAGIPFVTEEEASSWFNKYRGKFPRVPRYMDELVLRALRLDPPQYTNDFGRTRRIPELRALGNKRQGARASRMLIASRIQGGASELTKESIVRCQSISDWARAEGRWDARLALTIHDELQIDVDPEGALEAVTMFKAAMEDFPQLSAPSGGRTGVPVVCDAEWTATNWKDKVKVWPKAKD